MNLRKAQKHQSKIRIAIAGPSGSGKTYSSLLLAKGLTNDFSKVCIIDTEAGSADLYSHLGEYNVLTLQGPYSPEQYIKAIELAEQSGVECIILDSISQAWEYLVYAHSKLAGNSFTNWSLITPRHKALINKILNSNAHIICSLRTKTDYVLNPNDKGKIVPQKVGLKAIQRDGIDYEFTIYFEIDNNHHATCTKDRTGLFSNDASFIITTAVGSRIREWTQEGVSLDHIKKLIHESDSIPSLKDIFNQYSEFYPQLTNEFKLKKSQLDQIISSTKIINNGNHQ